MPLNLTRVDYRTLNPRQQENFNFMKISAVLADYGFTTMRLNDDWQGADFVAQHIDGETFLKVQLKGRLAFNKKYCGKGLYIAFFRVPDWYVYPHDEVLERVLSETNIIKDTASWNEKGNYHFPSLSKQLAAILEPYMIGHSAVEGQSPE